MLFFSAGPSIPPVVAYPKRSQTSTTDNDLKEEGIPSRKSSSSAAGGKGIAPASPMLGNASNPNKADIPERKRSSVTPNVSCGFSLNYKTILLFNQPYVLGVNLGQTH